MNNLENKYISNKNSPLIHEIPCFSNLQELKQRVFDKEPIILEKTQFVDKNTNLPIVTVDITYDNKHILVRAEDYKDKSVGLLRIPEKDFLGMNEQNIDDLIVSAFIWA